VALIANPDRRPKRNPSSAFKPIGDEGGLVVLPDRSVVKVLNPVGIRVFGLLDGERTLGQIVDLICEEYEVTPEKAAQDVETFVGLLSQEGMLADSGEIPDSSEVRP